MAVRLEDLRRNFLNPPLKGFDQDDLYKRYCDMSVKLKLDICTAVNGRCSSIPDFV